MTVTVTAGRRSAVLRRDGIVLIAPLTLFLLLLLALPVAVDIAYSVSRVSFRTLREPEFAGLDNFASVLGDPAFWRAVWFSLRFAALVTLAQLVLGSGLAIYLAPLLSAYPALLAALMLPMMVAPSLVGLMYRLILHEFVGMVPYYMQRLTGDSPAFLEPGTAFWTLATIETLQWAPFALLIVHTAFAAIPVELREAAAIDGAQGLSLLARVELPLLAPTLLAVGVIRLIDSLRVFDIVYVLTGSGAGGRTATISIWIYEAFFHDAQIGRAIAASLLLLVAVGGLLAVAMRRRVALVA